MARPGDQISQKKCESCGKLFTPKESRHTTCYDCFRQGKTGRTDRLSASSPSAQNQDFKRYLEQLRSAGYFNEKGYLRAELRVTDAEMAARTLANGGVSSSQIRRFFTMARSLEQSLKTTGDFDSIIPDLAAMQAFTAAIIGREQDNRKRESLTVLRHFIDENVEQARHSEEAFLKGFVPHFESVIAYFTFHKPK